MAISEDRVTENAELRLTESGEQRITEGIVTITTIIKYDLEGASDIRERPLFNYEFPQSIYVVVE